MICIPLYISAFLGKKFNFFFALLRKIFFYSPERLDNTPFINSPRIANIVGFSKLYADEQLKVKNTLTDIVKNCLLDEKLLKLDTGDGMAVAFLENPESPLLTAIKIASEAKKAGIPLRMGMHTGFVYLIEDINEQRNIVGGGINLAQRVMDCGDAGHILASKVYAEALSGVKKEYEKLFHNIGKFEVKHGVIIEIYNVYGEKDFGNSTQPQKIPKKGEISPLLLSLHNQTPPEPNFVGRKEMLEKITNWYKSSDVKIGALIGWGGFGKSALAREWYDGLKENNIQPDGIFWWGFYRNPYLDRFLEELLEYLAGGRIDLTEIKSTWQRVEKIKKFITKGKYLIILDGLEEMQKEEQGEEFGKMQHPEFKDLLTCIADSSYKGLCLITTRFPMKDIEPFSSYKPLDVEELSKEDTRLLFQKIGVQGTDDEIDAVWEEFKGHTLSLVLLANYLGVGDDIKKAKEILPFYSDKEAGGKAHRILLWYDKQLNENQRQFMKIFSLFRQAVGEREFEEIFLPRIKMEPFHFKRMVDDLCQRRLISKHSEFRLQTPDSRLSDSSYITHPLIKGYFESIFEEEEKRLCHKAIYEYFGKIAPDLPETLEEMQPLFEQVYHGTSAGLYDEVRDNVYLEKIYRGREFFIYHKLGAWETNLSLTRNFFPKGDFSQMPLVSKKRDQSFLLNEAGLALLSTGKPKEASEVLGRLVEMDTKGDDWTGASITLRNLAGLQFRTGELEKGLESAKKALEMSEKAKSDRYICLSKTYLAWILHLLGKDKEAEEYFKQADELERKISGNRLYCLWGIFYADFLISIKRIDEALKLTQANLEICRNILKDPNNTSRCHCCLASIERIKGNHKETGAHLQEALEIGRKVGVPHLEIETLLESSRLDLDTQKHEDAIHKANEALKLITRTGFRLYDPEAELILAKAHLAQGDKEKAKEYAQSAYEKADQMHYHWPKLEANEMSKDVQKRNP